MKIALIVIIWLGALWPLAIVANIVLADFYFTRGTNTGSISDLIEATTINPNEETYHRNLGLALAVAAKNEASSSVKQQLIEAADSEFKTAISLNQDNLLTLKAAIIGYTQLGDLKTAGTLARQVKKLSPTDPTAYPPLGL